ncbi:MAG: hypothetical protein EPN88_13945 [Bacteroidetes bacterium]|nr:MAG: hypothetical protein EPN88_13945 [Bacteroidota bacterium]
MKLYKALSRELYRHERVKKNSCGNGSILSSEIEKNIDGYLNKLSHGSGIDGRYRTELKNDKVIIYQEFHVMNDNGFYEGWINYSVTISSSLEMDFELLIKGNFGRKYQDIKEYLHEIYYEDLDQDVK